MSFITCYISTKYKNYEKRLKALQEQKDILIKKKSKAEIVFCITGFISVGGICYFLTKGDVFIIYYSFVSSSSYITILFSK